MPAANTSGTLPLPTFDKPVKLLIVSAAYHADITEALLAGAKAALGQAGATYDCIKVPGVLEIPTAIMIAERTSNFDGYVALGCILRDPNSRAKSITNSCFRALGQIGLSGICVGNGILSAKNHKQATAADQENGSAAANAALHLVALSRKWGRETRGIGFLPASNEFLMADTPDNGPKTA